MYIAIPFPAMKKNKKRGKNGFLKIDNESERKQNTVTELSSLIEPSPSQPQPHLHPNILVNYICTLERERESESERDRDRGRDRMGHRERRY